MEAKHQALERLGIFDAYATVHQAYADLACTTNALEAVKRASFLQWYASTEPSCFTGIFTVHAQAEVQVVECLEHHATSDTLDAESAVMLQWYYFISEYYFEQFPQHSTLLTYLQRHHNVYTISDTIDRIDLRRRGQMGKYWFSVLATGQ